MTYEQDGSGPGPDEVAELANLIEPLEPGEEDLAMVRRAQGVVNAGIAAATPPGLRVMDVTPAEAAEMDVIEAGADVRKPLQKGTLWTIEVERQGFPVHVIKDVGKYTVDTEGANILTAEVAPVGVPAAVAGAVRSTMVPLDGLIAIRVRPQVSWTSS